MLLGILLEKGNFLETTEHVFFAENLKLKRGYLEDKTEFVRLNPIRIFNGCGRIYFDIKDKKLIITNDCAGLEGHSFLKPYKVESWGL